MLINRIFVFVATGGLLFGKIEVPQFFSNGMVLQQGEGARIWGQSTDGEAVTVVFGKKKEKARPDQDGYWSVEFDGLEATSEGAELTMTSATDRVIVSDVVVGEVWLASGQSNMRWQMKQLKTYQVEAAIADSEDPLLRVYTGKTVASAEPQTDYSGKWLKASPKETPAMTSVGYYFARRLRKELNVPVGVIEVAWGGRPIESFISEEALSNLPEGNPLLEKKIAAQEKWDTGEIAAKHEANELKYQKKLEEWELLEPDKNGKKPKAPRAPRKPEEPKVNSGYAGTIFNGMISPTVGYTAQGLIWYQGETNAKEPVCQDYSELLSCLITDWRARWGRNLSFYYVQLANFKKVTAEPGYEDPWVVVQDEMRRALKVIPQSGMAVINEIGEGSNIHPRNKEDVGERLARWALAKDYGKKNVIPSGPLFRMAKRDGNVVRVSFDYAQGLHGRRGSELKRFEIKAKDGDWVWADALIDGEELLLSSPEVLEPNAIRYAWAPNPEGANLVNGVGLPASCFEATDL